MQGLAISTYKKLGFVAAGDPITIDLEKYGGEGIHEHIGMIREPRSPKVET